MMAVSSYQVVSAESYDDPGSSIGNTGCLSMRRDVPSPASISFDCTEHMYRRKTKDNARSAMPARGKKTFPGASNSVVPAELPPGSIEHIVDQGFKVG